MENEIYEYIVTLHLSKAAFLET